MTIPRPCIGTHRKPECPLLATKGPRCPGCERTFQSFRNRRPERQEYATLEYKAARLAVLGLPCWRCGEKATSADHVVPVREGGTWRDGLRPACAKCNADWRVG